MYLEYPELTLSQFNITSVHFTMDSLWMNFKEKKCVWFVNNAVAFSTNSLLISCTVPLVLTQYHSKSNVW